MLCWLRCILGRTAEAETLTIKSFSILEDFSVELVNLPLPFYPEKLTLKCLTSLISDLQTFFNCIIEFLIKKKKKAAYNNNL